MAPDSPLVILLDAFDVVVLLDASETPSRLLGPAGAELRQLSELPVADFKISHLPATHRPSRDGVILHAGGEIFRGQILCHDGAQFFVGNKTTELPAQRDCPEELEGRHQHIFERASSAILIYVDETIVAANPAACRMLEASEESVLVGRSIWDVIQVDSLESSRESIRALCSAMGSVAKPRELELRSLKGHPIAVMSSCRSVAFDGRPAIQSVMEDLTGKRSMERELQSERLVFEAAMTSVETAILVFDLEGRITYANASAGRLLGFSQPDLAKRRYNDPEWQLTSLDGQPLADDDLPYARVLRSEQPLVDARLAVLRADGQRCLLSVNGSPILTARGEMSGIVFSLLDITEIIQAEKRLRESEERLSLCIDGSGIGTWDWNVLSGDVEFSETWCSMLGFKQSEIESNVSSWETLVHPEDLPRTMTDLEEHFSGRRDIYRNEHRLKTKSGEWKWILASGRVVSRDFDGRPLRMLGTHLDIDPLKRAEAERHALEAQVQNTARLESMSVLAGGVAHDFNNLLVGIIGAAGVALLDAPVGHPLHDTIKLIESAGQRAANLTKQMLAFSGRGRFVIESVTLSQLIAEMEDLISSATSKRVPVRYEIQDDGAIDADLSQMSQVLMNLVMNAIEACERTPESAPKSITIRTGRLLLSADEALSLRSLYDVEAGTKVFVEVSDTGCGMDRATLARIFEPFFSTKGAGHGLGLAAVIGIVRGHRGFIEVQSTKNAGTTVRVAFPQAESGSLSQSKGKGDQMDAMRKVALIVDDEDLVSTVMRVALKRQGYDVVVTSNGKQGLEEFGKRRHELAVVFLDMTMPGMSGPEVLKEMKVMAPEIPIIAMSGYTAEAAGVGSIRKDIATFVQKPFRPDELIAALKRINLAES